MATVILIVQIVLVVISALMIVIILAQKSKSAGLGAAYGGDTQSFTTRGKAARTETKLQKVTIVLSIIMGVLALVLMVLPNFK
ncbi:MAG: preprotein translocase subunit SecG [Clostridiales bacterium]|nr:preprotein translocase subunit SecG [Clostridiales bacterium]